MIIQNTPEIAALLKSAPNWASMADFPQFEVSDERYAAHFAEVSGQHGAHETAGTPAGLQAIALYRTLCDTAPAGPVNALSSAAVTTTNTADMRPFVVAATQLQAMQGQHLDKIQALADSQDGNLQTIISKIDAGSLAASRNAFAAAQATADLASQTAKVSVVASQILTEVVRQSVAIHGEFRDFQDIVNGGFIAAVNRQAQIEKMADARAKAVRWTIVVATIVLLMTLFATRAHAQQNPNVAQAVTACGTQSYSNLERVPLTVDLTGVGCNPGGGGGGGGTSSTFGAAFPATGTAVGVDDVNGNMGHIKLDAQGAVVTTLEGSAVTIAGIATVTFGGTAQPVSGTVTANAGTNLNTSLLAVEAGGNLAAIKADTDKIPSLGQALAAGSTPVVLTAAQITTLTPPAAITGFALEAGHLATIDTSTSGSKTDLDTIAGAVSGSKYQDNIAQVGGTAVVTCGTSGCMAVGAPVSSTAYTSTLGATVFTVCACSAVVITDIDCFDGDAAANAFLQIFNATTVTVGTTTPKNVIGVPFGGGFQKNGLSWLYSNAIKVAATTTATGSTTATTPLVCNFGYRQ